jgi:hypothetical protein
MNTKMIVLAAATVCGLAAQDPSRRITANVPFGFETNGVKMAAGTYVMTGPTEDAIVKIFSKDTGKTTMLMALVANRDESGASSLEFKRYNGVYFLSAMKVGSTGQKVVLPYSRREKEMAIAIEPEVIIALAK